MRSLLGLLLLVTSLAGAVSADDASPLKTLMTGNDSAGWEAVGRLNIAGQSFCTGALIAPDLVLTAAHCLFDRQTGRRFSPDEIEFLAGWRNGGANAYANLSHAIAHPEFDFSGLDKADRVAHDVALLKLEYPIRKTSIVPFQTGKRPRKNAEVGVVSYAHDRADNPSLQEVCYVLARRSGTLILSCDVDYGSSGAPVFSIGKDGIARIVSIISAKAIVQGRHVALGASLERSLSELMELVAQQPARQSTPRIRVLPPKKPRSNSGAKFVRP